MQHYESYKETALEIFRKELGLSSVCIQMYCRALALTDLTNSYLLGCKIRVPELPFCLVRLKLGKRLACITDALK